MKKNLTLLILIIALIATTVTGCKKMEEIYACDPVTNEWVKSNLQTIQQMNRQDLLQLEQEKQIPAFRAFTPEQKYDCWMDKLEQVKSLEWTEKEISHICLLAESMKLEWFEKNFMKNNFDKINIFLNKWVNDGFLYFGWTKDEVGRMVACLYDVEMEDENVILRVGIGGGTIGVEARCTCSQTSDWCFWGEKCRNISCSGGGIGCGTLWLYQCDGSCGDTPNNQ